MRNTADLGHDLDQARYRLLAAAPGSVEFSDNASALSAAGQCITAEIEDAFVELTVADPEAA
jgi:hypothetical protein